MFIRDALEADQLEVSEVLEMAISADVLDLAAVVSGTLITSNRLSGTLITSNRLSGTLITSNKWVSYNLQYVGFITFSKWDTYHLD